MARHGVKQFTTWDYEDRVSGVKFKVPVSVVDEMKTTSYKSYGSEDGTYFRVQMEEPEIDERDTDINRLRKTVFAKIKTQLQIEWKSMLVVTVGVHRSRLFRKELKSDTPDTENSAGGKFEVEWYRVQIAQRGKQKMQRGFNSYYKPMHYGSAPGDKPREVWGSASQGWPNLTSENSRHRHGGGKSVMAMIPDTPENRQALESISDQIEKLYANLSKLLNAKHIEQTLAQIAKTGLLALTGPS